MNKQDYIKIANAIREVVATVQSNKQQDQELIASDERHAFYYEGVEHGIEKVVDSLVSVLKQNNPKFNIQKFYKATGVI